MNIPYQAVSIGAILRDYEKPEYANDEHRHLTDLADTIYNTCMTPTSNPEFFYPQFKRLYDQYSKEFWDLVLRDMRAIDSQISDHNIDDLREEYKELLHNIK